MRLEIKIDGDRDDILAQMTKIWGMIMEESRGEGVAHDGNGNPIGDWILVDWENKYSIRDYAQKNRIELELWQIKGSPNEMPSIDGMDAKDWFDAQLSD